MSERYRGIQEFIEHKQNVEKERPNLTVEPRLITVDGPDGVGKTTLAKALRGKLARSYGEDGVVYADITNLRGSPQQERLRRIKSKEDVPETQLDNKYYAAGVNRAYTEIVVPALEAGKIVVVDRSEVDLLRYALESGDENLVEEREKYIQSGSLTHRLWAGNRVFMSAPPEDIWENLNSRGKLSPYDPQSPSDVERRLQREEEAEQKILAMGNDKDEVNVIEINNRRAEDEEGLALQIEKVTEEVERQLEMPGTPA